MSTMLPLGPTLRNNALELRKPPPLAGTLQVSGLGEKDVIVSAVKLLCKDEQ